MLKAKQRGKSRGQPFPADSGEAFLKLYNKSKISRKPKKLPVSVNYNGNTDIVLNYKILEVGRWGVQNVYMRKCLVLDPVAFPKLTRELVCLKDSNSSID